MQFKTANQGGGGEEEEEEAELEESDDDDTDGIEKANDQTVKYSCQWSHCDCADGSGGNDTFKRKSTLVRHIKFHAFHTKLKQIGQRVLDSLNSQEKKKQLEEEEENDDNDDCSDDDEEDDKEDEEARASPKSITRNKHRHNKQVRCNLDEQTRNVIPELPFMFECSWLSCVYKTNDPELFYRHIRLEHVASLKPKDFANTHQQTKCMWSECEQILASKNRLTEHMRHHSQEKVAACPNCGALFASITKFIDHCNRSSEVKSKNYLVFFSILFVFV